jgi:hypothetical protein
VSGFGEEEVGLRRGHSTGLHYPVTLGVCKGQSRCAAYALWDVCVESKTGSSNIK